MTGLVFVTSLRRVKLTKLKAKADNPRLAFKSGELEAFEKSLSLYGDLGGVILNTKTGNLVGGHKRVESFKKDKKAEITITDRLSKPDATGTTAFGHVTFAGTRWGYREVKWSVEMENAANLAANEFGADFDWEAVANLLKTIEGKHDLTLTGFPMHEIENLLKAEWVPPVQEPMPEHVHGGKIDPIHLTKKARVALDSAKVALDESDDVAAILKLCEHYQTCISS